MKRRNHTREQIRLSLSKGRLAAQAGHHPAKSRAQRAVGKPQLLILGAQAAEPRQAVVVGSAEVDRAEHGVDGLLAIPAEGGLMTAAGVHARSVVSGMEVQQPR